MRSMANLNYLQQRIELARAELHKIAEERDNLLHPEVLEHSEQLDLWLNQYHQELRLHGTRKKPIVHTIGLSESI